jgi:lipoate synthase
LRKIITFKERKDLEDKMANVFQENLKGLSTELQRILLDDLVTAFQSRINVLTRVQKKASY